MASRTASAPAHPRSLSADERDAWLGLMSVVELLPTVLDAQLRRTAGLTHFDYHVLATLAEADDRSLPMTALAAHTNATLTRLSHGVRRLEDRGLVERRRSARDARVTEARLTAAGLDVVVQVGPGHADLVRRHVLDVLTPSQVGQLRQIGDALRGRLRSRSCGPARTRPVRHVDGATGRRRTRASGAPGPWSAPA